MQNSEIRETGFGQTTMALIGINAIVLWGNDGIGIDGIH
jgi:hypothetical protein